MSKENKQLVDLQDLLDYNARKLLYAELEIEKKLLDWIRQVQSEKMKEVLRRYSKIIGLQLNALKDFLSQEKILPLQTENKVMLAYISETEKKLKSCKDSEVRDACLLASVQEINHYKISNYSSAAAFANVLKMDTVEQIFHEAEVNEKQIDDRLSQLAVHELNAKAKTHLALPG